VEGSEHSVPNRRYEYMATRGPATAALAGLMMLGALAGCGASRPLSGSLSGGGCTLPDSSPYSGAPATLGLNGKGATVPVWSARIGHPMVVNGDQSFGIAYEGSSGSACVVAITLTTGQIQWAIKAPTTHPALLGVIGDSVTVLAAVGNQFGQAPAMVYAATTGLVAYDVATGAVRWTFTVPADSQAVPAVLAGGMVVVTEADGTVVGLEEDNGQTLWKDAAHQGCSGWLESLSPGAVPVGPLTVSSTGQTAAVIGYGCPTGGGVEALNPTDGSILWNWVAPEGWTPAPQMLTTVDTGSPTGEVAVVPISQVARANAPPVTAPAPAPALPTVIDNLYGWSQTNDVVVLDPGTGRPLWDLEGVAGQAVEAVGGADNLCVLTDVGADCRRASDGALRWSLYWPGKAASSTYPALSCIDQSAACAITADGRLYVALATDAAVGDDDNPPNSPPQSGIFDLTELDLGSGTRITSLPLPGYDNPNAIGVSLIGPPGVLQVSNGLALVSPQLGEADVIEAFTVS